MLSMLYVTEATQYCVTAGSTLIFKSVQSRELGQYVVDVICMQVILVSWTCNSIIGCTVPNVFFKVHYTPLLAELGRSWIFLVLSAAENFSHSSKEPDGGLCKGLTNNLFYHPCQVTRRLFEKIIFLHTTTGNLKCFFVILTSFLCTCSTNSNFEVLEIGNWRNFQFLRYFQIYPIANVISILYNLCLVIPIYLFILYILHYQFIFYTYFWIFL